MFFKNPAFRWIALLIGALALISGLLMFAAHRRLQEWDRLEAFADAVRTGTPEEVSKLIKEGADPNAFEPDLGRRNTLLENLPFVSKGADQNSKPQPILLLAALNEKHGAEVVRTMVKGGLDVERMQKSYPDLVLDFCYWKNIESLRQILEAGADPNLPGLSGQRPISLTFMWFDPSLVRLLMEHGALVDPSTRNALSGMIGDLHRVLKGHPTKNEEWAERLASSEEVLKLFDESLAKQGHTGSTTRSHP